jgi:hypothetical protein
MYVRVSKLTEKKINGLWVAYVLMRYNWYVYRFICQGNWSVHRRRFVLYTLWPVDETIFVLFFFPQRIVECNRCNRGYCW